MDQALFWEFFASCLIFSQGQQNLIEISFHYLIRNGVCMFWLQSEMFLSGSIDLVKHLTYSLDWYVFIWHFSWYRSECSQELLLVASA